METPAGAAHARKGLTLAALTLAAALAGCTPADPALMAQQNAALCENGTFPDQRINACSAIIDDASVEPTRRAAALVTRGMLRAEQGQHARAVADFGRALRLDANNTDALSQRGAVHEQRGAYDIALRDYDAALALDPGNSMAVVRREQAMQGQMDALRQQLARLSEFLTHEPDNAAALNERCWLRAINDQEIEGAFRDCNAALRAEPQFAAALDSRGLVNLKRGDFQAALSDYEAALAVEPRRGHFLYGRGLARMRLGQVEAGEADLEAAEAAEPGVTQAYRGYGEIPQAPATKSDKP